MPDVSANNLYFSLSRDQARPLYVGDDSADVQDFGAERVGLGLRTECALLGRHQVLR